MYHPAQDVNHSVFRALLILEHTVHKDIGLEVYRLLDFYILFPHMLKHIHPFPISLRSFKSSLSEISEPFEVMRNTKRILYELESLQNVALHNLLAKQLIDIGNFKSGYLRRTSESIPLELIGAIHSYEQANKDWFRMIVDEFPRVDFGGKNGFKKRTGLMEFRYDMVAE